MPNPSGSNDPKVTADELVAWMDPEKRYVTKEFQDEFDISQPTAHRRLTAAVEDGKIRKEKPGHRSVFWIKPAADGEGAES
ncbi:MAG: hypothetical protein ABEI11_00085 [Haloarculaceae archaeon]